MTSVASKKKITMQAWSVHDAKARFSAVLVPMAEWQRLQHAARPTLKALLLTDDARGEFNIPSRGGRKRSIFS